MAQPLKIIVVGAGIGGLACSIALRRQGLDVLVLERTETLTPVGAGIQIPPNASRIWAQYDLLDQLNKYSVTSEETKLRRWEDGKLLCSRNIGEQLDRRWPWLVIHRADYQRVLLEEARRLGVDIRLGIDIQDVDLESTKVFSKTGEEFSGDVVIGADGLWSTLRTYILGQNSPPKETGDIAYRGTFSLSALQALGDSAVDELCRQSIVTLWIGPESHAIFYPVRSGEEFNLVMTRPDNLPRNIKVKKGDVQEMKAVFRGWDPVLTKILSACSSILIWKMLHHDELTSWTKNNVALLGDACHPSLPYQAQGAAMAVEDGAIVATLLGEYQKDASLNSLNRPCATISDTLKLYESLQKARTTTLHLGSISNQHMYHLPDGSEQKERDQVLMAATWREKGPGEEEKFIWIDVKYQKAVLERDAVGDAKRGWAEMGGVNGERVRVKLV